LVRQSPSTLAAEGLIDEDLAARIVCKASGESVFTCHRFGTGDRWYECHVATAEASGMRVVVFAREVTERVLMEAALREQTRLDPLTGLLNHAAFHQRTAEALDPRHARSGDVGLVLIDLDYLKVLNDLYGHPVGDQAITAVAAAIRAETNPDDVVGRLGGDEFACLLVDRDRDSIERIADRIVARVGSHVVGPAGPLSISAGVAFVASTREPGDLFDRADRALYDSKATGRGVVTIAADTEIGYESRRFERPGQTTLAPIDLGSATSTADAARAALREWVHLLGASGGCIDLLDEAGVSVKACTYFRFGHDDWRLAEESYRLEDYPNTNRAIALGTTYTCRVDDPDADPAEVALLRQRGFASLLLTPLVAGGRALGIVELFDTRHRTFTTNERRVAQSLGTHLAALLAHLRA
jgi:diguanylate cyclase (GGDEF)-like protein